MTSVLILRTPKRKHWLLLEHGRYRRCMPSAIRSRLRELGLVFATVGLKGQLRASQIADKYGALVSRDKFDAAEREGDGPRATAGGAP